MSILGALLFASCLTHPQDPQTAQLFAQIDLPSQSSPGAMLEVLHYISPMRTVKEMPETEWQFPYVSVGMAETAAGAGASVRFRVFSQSRASETPDEISQWVARMMVRLWDYAYYRCDLDHNPRTQKTVDVYLCKSGDSGSQQKFVYDYQELDAADRPSPKNLIAVYQIDKAKRGIQLSRELAHEYGHAVIPPAGGFEKPESYTNGDIGERVFLAMFRDDLAKGKLAPEDTLFTDKPALDAYYEAKVKPAVLSIAGSGPDFPLLKTRTETAYWGYVNTIVYLSRICPPRLFGRTLALTTRAAEDLGPAVKSAAEEQPTWEVSIPVELKGKPLFIPLVKGSVTGAKVLKKSGDWAMIQPEPGKKVVVANPPLPPDSKS